jgi:hypothetical protein
VENVDMPPQILNKRIASLPFQAEEAEFENNNSARGTLEEPVLSIRP